MHTLKNIIRFQNNKVLFFILLNCQFYFANAFTLKEDSLKSNFAITDPRNPHCPCHKFQKMADDEFRKLLRKDTSTNSEGVIKINPNKYNTNYSNAFNGNNDLNSKNKNGTKKFRSKKRTFNFLNFKKKNGAKRCKVRRLRRDNITCFHF